jgi:hypothetical protein
MEKFSDRIEVTSRPVLGLDEGTLRIASVPLERDSAAAL